MKNTCKIFKSKEGALTFSHGNRLFFGWWLKTDKKPPESWRLKSRFSVSAIHDWSNYMLILGGGILSPLCGVFSNFEWNKKKSSVSSSSHIVCKMERQVVNKGRQWQLNLWGGNFYIHGFNISYQWKVWLCIVVVRHLGLHKKLEKLFTTKLECLNGLSNISICNWDAQNSFAKKLCVLLYPAFA